MDSFFPNQEYWIHRVLVRNTKYIKSIFYEKIHKNLVVAKICKNYPHKNRAETKFNFCPHPNIQVFYYKKWTLVTNKIFLLIILAYNSGENYPIWFSVHNPKLSERGTNTEGPNIDLKEMKKRRILIFLVWISSVSKKQLSYHARQ